MKPSLAPWATAGPRLAPAAGLSGERIAAIPRLSGCGWASHGPGAAGLARPGGEDPEVDLLVEAAAGGATAN
jgi:hypothetical protein